MTDAKAAVESTSLSSLKWRTVKKNVPARNALATKSSADTSLDVISMAERIHVLPVDDLKPHVETGAWCHCEPRIDGDLVIHKPKCSQCSTIGWATTYVHPVPIVTQSLAGEVIATALLVCGKCGAQREHNLNVLGITVTPQERRVLTPSEIAGQKPKPLIVQP